MCKYFPWYEITVGTFIYQSGHSFIEDCFRGKHFLLLLLELKTGFSLENHYSLVYSLRFSHANFILGQGLVTQTWPTRALGMIGLLGLVQTGQTQLNLS